MKLIKKVMFRISRILTGNIGIYGKVGKNNKYTKGVFVSEDAKVGNNNYIGPYSMLNNTTVGNYCSIGPGVKIGQGNHSNNYITTCQKISGDLIGHSLNTTQATIGNDVWCGANVVILQGVKIGDGAIIGANAVVTNDIPDYAIAVGVPAKVVKYRFKTTTITAIKYSNWFNYDIDKAKRIIKSLENELKINDDLGE